MTTISRFLAIGTALAGLSHVAQAIPMLRVFDGTTTLTISDNLLGDVQSAPGQVLFVGSIGAWSLNVHTGTTFPAVGTLANPILDISFNATSTGAGGTLQISFSADGFGPTSANAVAAIGGTIGGGNGSVSYSTYGGSDNTTFSTTNLLTSQGPFTSMSYSNTLVDGVINNQGPYSLTQVVTITHGAGNVQTTGDAFFTVRAVPDGGSSLLLLGGALSAMVFVARRRRQ